MYLLEANKAYPEEVQLCQAAENGHEGTVRLLLVLENVNPNARDNFGWTALLFAASNGTADATAR